MRATGLLEILRRTHGFALPSLCAVCNGWGVTRICDSCRTRFAAPHQRCSRCALEVDARVEICGTCLVDPPPHRHALAAVNYAWPWSSLIANFKFHGALDLAPACADLLLAAQHRGRMPRPTLLVPVPLSAARLRERGYNQAWELARRVGRKLRVAADPELLRRVRDTPHQLALAPDRRAANVRGAFTVAPAASVALRGRDVTLVDDVMTTGATVAEAARVLLAAGAAQVDVWIVARTPRPGATDDPV